MKSLTREQVRAIDRRCAEEFGLSGLVLMENAGRSCVEVLRHFSSGGFSGELTRPWPIDAGPKHPPERLPATETAMNRSGACSGTTLVGQSNIHSPGNTPELGPVVICCGKGNNGGDGFVIARLLDALGIAVKIVLFARPVELKGDAAANYQIALRSSLPIVLMGKDASASEIDQQLGAADWIIDALLGTGATGDPKPPLSIAIERINACQAKVFSVDLPSGLDCDTGERGAPTARADVTCTFIAPKIGFDNPRAREVLGTVEVGSIGAPRVLLDQYLKGDDQVAQ